MSNNLRVLELLIRNADMAAKFESVVKSAAKNQGEEFFRQNAIGASGLVGLKPVDPTGAPMQCSYGL